jgi:hypothetical protein
MDNRQAEAAMADSSWVDGSTPWDNSAAYTGAGDWEIEEGVEAPTVTAAQIEAEGSFKSIPAGDNIKLVVVGFIVAKESTTGPIVYEHVDVYWVPNGRKDSYRKATVSVKLAALPGQVVGDITLDPSYQVVDWFDLPPADPKAYRCFMEGFSKPDCKPSSKGFGSRKTFHFLERLGFVWPRGGKLPDEVRKLKNWVGKKVIADIKMGDPLVKQVRNKKGAMETKTYPARPKVSLFSYRPHPDTLAQFRRAGELAAKEPAPVPALDNSAPPPGGGATRRRAPLDV